MLDPAPTRQVIAGQDTVSRPWELWFRDLRAAVLASGGGTTVLPIQASLLWSYKVPGGEPVYSTPILATINGTLSVIFQCWDWYLYVLLGTDGTLVWRKAFSLNNYGRAQAADVNGDGQTEVFGASHDGQIHALDHNGGNLWQFNNLYAREGTGTATSGTINSLTDASKSWVANSFLRRQGLGFGATLNLTGGTGSGQQREIIAVTSHTLTVLTNWGITPDSTTTYTIIPRFPSDVYYQHAGTLSLESGVWYLYVTGFDGQCVKINANTGAQVWQFSALENNEPFPLIMDVDGDGQLECIFSSVDSYVYCLDTATGLPKWSLLTDPVNFAGLDAFLSAADINNDGIIEILVASRADKVFVVRGTDGQIVTTSATVGGNVDDRPAIFDAVAGLRNFGFGDDSGQATVSDSAGATVWRKFLGDTINSSPTYGDVDNDGNNEFVVCDMSGVVYVLDPKDGTLLGQFTVPGPIEGTPLLADINGDGLTEFVITNNNGYVQAYRMARTQ